MPMLDDLALDIERAEDGAMVPWGTNGIALRIRQANSCPGFLDAVFEAYRERGWDRTAAVSFLTSGHYSSRGMTEDERAVWAAAIAEHLVTDWAGVEEPDPDAPEVEPGKPALRAEPYSSQALAKRLSQERFRDLFDFVVRVANAQAIYRRKSAEEEAGKP